MSQEQLARNREFLTTGEAAKFLGLSRVTIYSLVLDGFDDIDGGLHSSPPGFPCEDAPGSTIFLCPARLLVAFVVPSLAAAVAFACK